MSADRRAVRIGYVGPMAPDPGGISQHGYHLVTAFEEAGHQVTKIGWQSPYPGSKRRGRDEAGVGATDMTRMLKWWSPRSWIRAGRRLSDRELVIAQYIHPFHAWPLATVIRRAGCPAVIVAHNVKPHEWFPFTKWLARRVFSRARVVLVHSEFVGAEAVDVLPDVDLLTIAMPPLIPVEKGGELPRSPFRLLFLGYVRTYKGLDQLLEALQIARQRGTEVELTVAGEFWKDEDRYRNRISDLGLAEAVSVQAGYLPDEEVGVRLASHHALVAPYQQASQSGVVPLARAAGRPALVTDVGGLSEQVDHGVDGLVVGSDPVSLADGIVAMVRDYDRLASGAARASVSWADMVDAILDSVRDVE